MCEFDGAWVWWWRWWCGQQLSWHRAGGCREIGSRKKGRAVHWNTTTHQYYCLLRNTFWIMHNCNTICSLDHILKKRLKAGIRWQVLDRLIFLKPKKTLLHGAIVIVMHWWIYQSNTGKKEHPAEPPLCIRLLETSSWSVPKMRSFYGKCIVYSAGSIYLWHSSGGLDVDITTSGVSTYCCPWFCCRRPF